MADVEHYLFHHTAKDFGSTEGHTKIQRAQPPTPPLHHKLPNCAPLHRILSFAHLHPTQDQKPLPNLPDILRPSNVGPTAFLRPPRSSAPTPVLHLTQWHSNRNLIEIWVIMTGLSPAGNIEQILEQLVSTQPTSVLSLKLYHLWIRSRQWYPVPHAMQA